MASENNLPLNDPDVVLAQSIGALLESRSSFKEINDPLIDQLVIYKELEISAITHSTENRNTFWQHIETKTKKRPNNIIRLIAQQPIYAWASAAVLLITAFIGFYWIKQQPQLELIAKSGSKIEIITLDDGTEVTLRPNSQLYRNMSHKSTKAYSLNGEAFFDVVSDPDVPFSVDGNKSTVTVLGTRFNFSNWGEKAMIYLEKGKVSFTYNLTGDELILYPGQSSQVLDGKIELLSESHPNQFTDWISNTIIFNNNTPNEVIQEIGHHFNVYINIDQLVNRSGIDGSLQLNSISQTLNDLGLVLGGSFQQLANNEFIFISME